MAAPFSYLAGHGTQPPPPTWGASAPARVPFSQRTPPPPPKKPRKEFATRFSASLPPQLMRQLDAMVREKGYDNRSLAIADMIRAQLVEHATQQDDTA